MNVNKPAQSSLSTTSDTDLINLAKKLDINLKGIHMVNELPKKIQTGCYIVNSDDEYRGGKHWTCIYNDSNQKNCLHFDPFGVAIDLRIKKFMKTSNKHTGSLTTQIQSLNENSCGYWVMFFLHMMDIGVSPVEFLSRFNGIDQDKNEKLLEKWFLKLK